MANKSYRKSLRGFTFFNKKAEVGLRIAELISETPIEGLPLKPDEKLVVLASNSEQVNKFTRKWGLGLSNSESTLFSKSKQRRV